jgi:hypothetical protein
MAPSAGSVRGDFLLQAAAQVKQLPRQGHRPRRGKCNIALCRSYT